jgi:Ca2+-binding EF-hand superfamily protein
LLNGGGGEPDDDERLQLQKALTKRASMDDLMSSEVTCMQKMEAIVRSDEFVSAVSFVVLTSVVVLGIQTHYIATNLSDHWIFEVFEYVFAFLFTIEITMRLIVDGCGKFYCGQEKVGNWFDFSLVSAQVINLASDVLDLSKGSSQWTGFLRVLRLVRVIRLIRVFNVVPDLRILLVSILQSFRPLMWVLVLVMIVTATFGVIITTVANEFRVDSMMASKDQSVDSECDTFASQSDERSLCVQLVDNFGGLDRSILSLYGAISGGQDWRSSAQPLMNLVGRAHELWFVAYTFFVIFAMMNVITSQFVDTAIEASAKDRRENMVNNLMHTFEKAAENVDEDLFMSYLGNPNMKTFLKDLYKREDVTDEEIRESRLFDMLDNDHGGTITRDELILGCVKLTGSATSLDLAVLKLDVQQIRAAMNYLVEIQYGHEKAGELFPKSAKTTAGKVKAYA